MNRRLNICIFDVFLTCPLFSTLFCSKRTVMYEKNKETCEISYLNHITIKLFDNVNASPADPELGHDLRDFTVKK